MTLETIEQKIKKGKPLTTDENNYLFSIKSTCPKKIVQLLADGNSRIIFVAAKKYREDPEYEDLLQEGYLALQEAILHFDPTKGAPFYSYAYSCIRNRIANYMQTKRRLIPLPYYIFKQDGFDMQKLPVLSLNVTIPIEGCNVTLAELIPSDENIEETTLDQLEAEETLKGIQAFLSHREYQILSDRYGLNGKPALTRMQVHEKYNVSPQYVSYAEKRAINKIRERRFL